MMNTFKSIHSGDKTLEDIEQEQNKFKKEITIIKQGNSKQRSEEQQKAIILKIILKIFINQDKKLLICLITTLKTFLKVFMKQSLKEKDLKY